MTVLKLLCLCVGKTLGCCWGFDCKTQLRLVIPLSLLPFLLWIEWRQSRLVLINFIAPTSLFGMPIHFCAAFKHEAVKHWALCRRYSLTFHINSPLCSVPVLNIISYLLRSFVNLRFRVITPLTSAAFFNQAFLSLWNIRQHFPSQSVSHSDNSILFRHRRAQLTLISRPGLTTEIWIIFSFQNIPCYELSGHSHRSRYSALTEVASVSVSSIFLSALHHSFL